MHVLLRGLRTSENISGGEEVFGALASMRAEASKKMYTSRRPDLLALTSRQRFVHGVMDAENEFWLARLIQFRGIDRSSANGSEDLYGMVG